MASPLRVGLREKGQTGTAALLAILNAVLSGRFGSIDILNYNFFSRPGGQAERSRYVPTGAKKGEAWGDAEEECPKNDPGNAE